MIVITKTYSKFICKRSFFYSTDKKIYFLFD